MWVKVFSPTVSGIELVKRAERRIRRARLFYMRYVVFLLADPNWRFLRGVNFGAPCHGGWWEAVLQKCDQSTRNANPNLPLLQKTKARPRQPRERGRAISQSQTTCPQRRRRQARPETAETATGAEAEIARKFPGFMCLAFVKFKRTSAS